MLVNEVDSSPFCCPSPSVCPIRFGYQSWAVWAELISHQKKKKKKFAVKLLKWKSERGAEPGQEQRGCPPTVLEDQARSGHCFSCHHHFSWCYPVHSVIKCNRFCFPSWMWLTERGLKCVWKGLAQCSSGFKKAHINVYLESGKQTSR